MGPQSESTPGGERYVQPATRSGDSTSRRVLEDVIKQTAALNSAEQREQLANLQSLTEVARRLPGVEFQFDPVVIELVRATLARQIKNSGQSAEQFEAVVARVARTLFDNPETQERLRSLWSRLSVVD